MSERLTKAEKRELRAAKKGEERRVKAVKFASSIPNGDVKQIKIAPIIGLGAKVVKTSDSADQEKKVYIANQAQVSPDCNLTWCISHSDRAGEWSWKEPRSWTKNEWDTHIQPAFNELERCTWHEIENVHKVSAKGDKRVPKNHPQEVSSLVNEAKQRWLQLGLEEYDTAFRFRFGGTVRAWGVKLSGHFYLVWWERHHQIYPV